MMAIGKSLVAKTKKAFRGNGEVGDVKVDDTDFYASLPGFKTVLQEKKKTAFAAVDTTAQRQAAIVAQFPTLDFDKEIVEERYHQRLDHQKKVRLLKRRFDREFFKLMKSGEFLDETEEPDNNLSLLWYGANVTHRILHRQEVKADNKAKRAANKHALNAAAVKNRHLIAEEPQAPRFRGKRASPAPLLHAPEPDEERSSFNRPHRGAKRQRCAYVDDEAQEVPHEEAEAEDDEASPEDA